MLERLQAVLLHECVLQPGLPLLAGASGGPDSLCLLHLLWRLGWQPVVAHLDHRLRPESADEAEALKHWAARHDLAYYGETADVAGFAAKGGYSVEEAARLMRYRFLFRLAAETGAQAVAVGHTADDQAETVLMHFLRGSGLDGLKGMAYRSLPHTWSETIPLVRPLLGTWRKEVEAYIAEHGLQPALDPTNQDTRYFRNRLRHVLLPELESYNPRVREAIWRTAEVLRADDAFLAQAAAQAFDRCRAEQGPDYIRIDRQALKAEPLAIRRRVLRMAIASLRAGLRDIDFAAIEEALAFIESPTRTSQRDLIAGLTLRLEADHLWIAAHDASLPAGDWPQLPAGAVYHLDPPAVLELPGGWRLRAGFADTANWDAESDANRAWLDADRLQFPLQVRTRRPGDRFQPLGMGGRSQKLSDFFINLRQPARLPARARDGWPLVLSGDTIAWLPGLRLAEPFRVTESTRRLLALELEKPA